MRLRDARTGWGIFDITLLRPAGWMAEHSRPLGGGREVWVDFEELHARGWAEVIEERPCPKIAEGPGRVVTATITHANDDVRTLTLSSGEVLYVTGNHRMFSATRGDWVPVKDLRVGEDLRTAKGRESVASLGYQRGRHQVYNLEVETEHCYFVGETEVLSHNTCVTETQKNADELRKNLGREGRGPEAGEAAGHIVASTGKERQFAPAVESRAILQKYGVGINDAANGVPVGTPRPHNEMHTGSFHQGVRDKLKNTVQSMTDKGYGAKAIRSALRKDLRKVGKSVRRR